MKKRSSKKEMAKQGTDMIREIGQKVIREIQRKQANEVRPEELQIELAFEERFPRNYNTLLADPERRLFLADTQGDNVVRGEELIPLETARASDFKEVTLKEALRWYCKCNPFSTSSTGSVELLCEMAAERVYEDVQ